MRGTMTNSSSCRPQQVRVRSLESSTRRHPGVEYGETVTFRNEGKQFTFVGLDLHSVDVSRIAPAGFAARPLVIYIPKNPSTMN